MSKTVPGLQDEERERALKAINSNHKPPGRREDLLAQTATASYRQPPPDLGPVGRALWEEVTRDYMVGGPTSYEALAQACRSLDCAERCRAQIAVDGLKIRTNSGFTDNPLIMREVTAIAVCILTLQRLEAALHVDRRGMLTP